MTDRRIAHTAQLDRPTLDAVHALLVDAFGHDFTEQDWEHALGGMHVLIDEDGELAGHAAVVQRRLVHAGRALRCGYVEGVAVRASSRRRGHGAALMAAIGDLLRRAYDVGALGATDEAIPLYERHGWQRWRGPLSAMTPAGVVETPQYADAVFVLPLAVPPARDEPLMCDWRDGDVW